MAATEDILTVLEPTPEPTPTEVTKEAETAAALATPATAPAPAEVPAPPAAPAPVATDGTAPVNAGTSRIDAFLDYINVWRPIYFFQSRPDLLFLLLSFISVAGVIAILWGLDMYDRMYGYLGPVSAHFKAVRELGYKGIAQLRDPTNQVDPAHIYKTIQNAAKLTDAQIVEVKVAMSARKAHDLAFGLHPFHHDPIDDILQTQLKVQTMIGLAVLLSIAWPFVLAYILWFLVKYWKVLFPAAGAFMLEVLMKFLVDTIVAEVKKVMGGVTNSVVKVFTFGRKKSPAVTVTMPVFSDYTDKWYAKYVQPPKDDASNEYTCKVLAKTRFARDAINALTVPFHQMVDWFRRIKARGIDIPFAQFRQLVLDTYPAFVTSHSEYIDDLRVLERKFYKKVKADAKAAAKVDAAALPAQDEPVAVVEGTEELPREIIETPTPAKATAAPTDATSAVVDICPNIL